ncbi:MAG: LLM class flavin-dependent oxidoreductase [Chloroflexia bacterium]
MVDRPFRFGVTAASARSGEEWLEKARRVETLGYSTLVTPDNVEHILAPMPALAAAAATTTTLRLGSYVFANDYRNPVMLAKEAATLDLLSGGRFELGIGAGRPNSERDNGMLGMPFDSGAVRLARLEEAISIIKALLAGDTVTTTGPQYAVTDAHISPGPVQQPAPLLIACSGKRMLELAAREATTVALGIGPDVPAETAAEKVEILREAAGERFGEIEINVSLIAVGSRVVRYMQFGRRRSYGPRGASPSYGARPTICASSYNDAASRWVSRT